MKCIQRCLPHNQLTRRWTSSFGISGRHRSVQVDAFVGSAHSDQDPNRSRAVQTCCGAISVAGIPKVAGAEEVIKLD
jgi:hypothetical protein